MNTDTHRYTQIERSQNESPNLNPRLSKIYEQADLELASVKIVQALSFMNAAEFGNGFHFDKHAVLDKQVGDIFPHDDTIVSYSKRMLLNDSQTALT